MTKHEEWCFALSINGRAAGQQLWKLERIPQDGGTLYKAEVQTDFWGALPAQSIFQTSESWLSDKGEFGTRHYTEERSDGQGDWAFFETDADLEEGLLIMKTEGDQASIPLLQEYQDPLSLSLMILLNAGQKVIQAKMIASKVFARLISQENDLFVYSIIPGKPQVIIKSSQLHSFTQPSPHGLIYGERRNTSNLKGKVSNKSKK